MHPREIWIRRFPKAKIKVKDSKEARRQVTTPQILTDAPRVRRLISWIVARASAAWRWYRNSASVLIAGLRAQGL